LKSVLFYIILFGFGFSPLFAQLNFDASNQLLWEINRPHHRPSYIYGTIHLNDPRLFNFPDSVYFAFNHTDVFCPEIEVTDLFPLLKTTYNQKLLVNNEGKIYSLSKLDSVTSYGSIFGWPQFLDAYFYQIAVNSEKSVIPLETIEQQTDAFSAVQYRPLSMQFSFSQNELIKTYLSGNLSKLQKITQQGFMGSTGYDELILKRNATMVKKLDSLLKRKSCFVAVGAGHLPGKYGILTALVQKGYRVRPIVVEYAKKQTSDEVKFNQFRNFHYSNDSLHFQMTFGMKPVQNDNGEFLSLETRDLGQANVYLLEVEKVDSSSMDIQQYLDENFYQPINAKIKNVKANDGTIGYEGIISLEGYGLCWRRVFFKNGFLYKLTCSGSFPFMISNRPQLFFSKFKFTGK